MKIIIDTERFDHVTIGQIKHAIRKAPAKAIERIKKLRPHRRQSVTDPTVQNQ